MTRSSRMLDTINDRVASAQATLDFDRRRPNASPAFVPGLSPGLNAFMEPAQLAPAELPRAPESRMEEPAGSQMQVEVDGQPSEPRRQPDEAVDFVSPTAAPRQDASASRDAVSQPEEPTQIGDHLQSNSHQVVNYEEVDVPEITELAGQRKQDPDDIDQEAAQEDPPMELKQLY